MRRLKHSLVLLLSFIAFACTEQINPEETQPLNETIEGKSEAPILLDGPPVTYITVEFGVSVDRDAVYNEYTQVIRILSRTDCPMSGYSELWEVPELTEAEFLEMFTDSNYGNVTEFTAGTRKSRDPYARDPNSIYFLHDLQCSE